MEQAARVRRAMVVASAVINNLRLKHYPPSAGFLFLRLVGKYNFVPKVCLLGHYFNKIFSPIWSAACHPKPHPYHPRPHQLPMRFKHDTDRHWRNTQ